jgi:hypothetical protein
VWYTQETVKRYIMKPLWILEINNKKQDCKIDAMCDGVLLGRGEGKQRRVRWGNTVDGLYIPIWTKTMKPLAIAWSGPGRGVERERFGGNLTNVQYKSIWNCHNESPLYNECIIIKIFLKKFMDKIWKKWKLWDLDTDCKEESSFDLL